MTRSYSKAIGQKFITLTFTSLVLSSLLTFSHNLMANTVSKKENTLKAALIYRMGSYLSWSIKPNEISYCFVGDNSHQVGDVLTQQQKAGKIPTRIKVLNKISNEPDLIDSCNLLFVSDTSEIDKATLEAISQSVFTITTSSDSLTFGYIASIEFRNNKPMLSISKDNLKRSNISVNSRFLSHVKLF